MMLIFLKFPAKYKTVIASEKKAQLVSRKCNNFLLEKRINHRVDIYIQIGMFHTGSSQILKRKGWVINYDCFWNISKIKHPMHQLIASRIYNLVNSSLFNSLVSEVKKKKKSKIW